MSVSWVVSSIAVTFTICLRLVIVHILTQSTFLLNLTIPRSRTRLSGWRVWMLFVVTVAPCCLCTNLLLLRCFPCRFVPLVLGIFCC